MPSALGSVIFVIDLAQDSYFAPGRTFVVPHDHLFDSPATGCAPPACGHLPGLAELSGSYVMNPCVQSPPSECTQGLGFYLGNGTPPGNIGFTALPVTATYRMLQDPWKNDVVSLGLPVEPVVAQAFVNEGSSDLGPQGGPSFAFQTYLEPGSYEQSLVPDSPFNSVFGPEISTGDVMAGGPHFERDVVTGFDTTAEEVGLGKTLPTFDIGRADGLEGWTAYLRDTTTRETLSNVRALSGTLAQGVLLVTNHVPPGTDALTNAELVVAPPAALSVPTGVFPTRGAEIPAQITYPPLPQPVTMTGNIVTANGTPVAADLVFEALALADENGLNRINFEFVGYASARPSPSGIASSYSVALPPGQYRVDVRPVDETGAVSIVELLVDASPGELQRDFSLLPMSTIQGTALVLDGRPLSGATVEALPTRCFTPPAVEDAGTPGAVTTLVSSPSCLPRPGQATTASDGAFTLPLDPGAYLLRVQPADGTRLPWVAQGLSVDGASTTQAVAVTVPAPSYAGLQLLDPVGNAIVNAVVRAFAVPAQADGSISPPAPAIELGRALTDTHGQFDLYVSLPSP